MFLKPFRVKTQTSLKGSDRKKLRSDVQKQYPMLKDEDVSVLVPNKEEVLQTKVCTHGDEHVVIYSVAKNPVFYEIFRHFYPTVYALWQFPDLLQSFRTWPQVFDKLLKGADLMLPGVLPDKPASPAMFGRLRKGDIVSVTLLGNRAPVALGKALLSGEDMYMSALRGKGVAILHIMGDHLWEFGSKSQPPVLPESQAVEGVESLEEDTDGVEGPESSQYTGGLPDLATVQLSDPENGMDGAQADGQGDDTDHQGEQAGSTDLCQADLEDEEEEERDPVAEMDELMHFCFACALKAKVKKADLPLLTGNFLRNHMQPFSPDKQLDVKKSSFKKFSKFLQAKVSEGYIRVREQSKGVDVITEIDRSHIGLCDLEVPELEEEVAQPEGKTDTDESYTPLTFTDVYCVNAQTQEFFREQGVSKGDAMLLAEVREHVTNYIRTNNLQHEKDKKQVTLDPILAHTVLKPSEGDLDHMSWEHVFNRVLGKMQSGVAISSGQGPVTIKKGKLDPIKLDISMRASQKKVTVVENLEDYGIDTRVFSRLIQRAVACSASVVQSEQKGKGPQVLIQGNQINFLASFLIDKYKIPRRYVTGLDKAPKQKKKR